jgi:predicted nucleic acid-binding Zn finger protein
MVRLVHETLGKDVIEVHSDRTPGVVYRVDLINGRCSCPAWKFQKGGARLPCKHLRGLGFLNVLPTTRGIRDADLRR